MRRATRLIFILAINLAAIAAALAQPVAGGYFRGMRFEPMLDAEPQIATADPAVVLVFSPTSQNSDIVAKFDAWYHSGRPNNVTAFGVVTGTTEYPLEVMEEVLRQRDLKFPVFFTEAPIQGTGDRVLVVRGGQAQTLTSVSAPEIAAKLGAPSGLAVATATAAVTPAATVVPTPGVIAAPTPAPTAVATPIVTPTPAAAVIAATTSTVTTQSTAQAGTYVNQRYDYTVTFPAGRTFIAAQNNDGAVSKSNNTSSLDFRVWASSNSSSDDGNSGTMDMSEYLKRHLSFIAEEYSTRVNVDRKFQVRDQDIEGRDYTYTFTRMSPRTGRKYEVRGRIQVFEANGIFKIASVEGDAEEFTRSTDQVEKFMLSFKPITR